MHYKSQSECLHGDKMSKTPTTEEDAIRVQSHSDKTNTNQGFKARVMSAAAKNKK